MNKFYVFKISIVLSFLFIYENIAAFEIPHQFINPTIDSLITVLQNSNDDTSKIKLYNEISWNLVEYNFQLGSNYADSAISLSKKIKWRLGEAHAYNNYGELFQYKGEINKAIKSHESALVIYNELSKKNEIANTYRFLGTAHFFISRYAKSLEYYNRSLKLFKELEDKKGISKVLSHLGILYSTLNDFEKGLEYFRESLVIEKILNNKINIGVQYGNIGINYYELKDYDKALENLTNALKIFEESGDYYNYSVFLSNAGKVYAATKEYSKAREYYKKSLKYDEEIGDEYGMAYQYGQMGNLNLLIINENNKLTASSRKELLDNAIKYFKIAIDKFSNIGNEEEKSKFMLSLSESYELNGDYQRSLSTYKIADEIQDSIHSSENKKIISEMEIKQELDLKEKEIDILNKRKENEEIIKNSLIGFIGAFIIISGTIFFFYMKKRRDNEILQDNINIRKKTEDELKLNQEELKKYQNNLEEIVKERTENLEKEISERLLFETAFKETEDKYKRLIELAPDAFFQGDEKGNFITTNNKAIEQTGYSKEELLSMNMKDLFSKNILNKKPLRYDLLQKGETIKAEREIVKKDGGTLFVEMNSKMMPDGTYLSFFRDITKQKLAVIELEKQKTFFEQMYLQSATSTQILDSEGWCLRINPKLSELFGVKPEDIEGRKYNIFHDEEIKRNGIDKILKEVISERKAKEWIVNFDIKTAADSQNIHVSNPKKIWFSNIAYPIIDSNDEIMFLIIQHENITDRKNAEEEIILAKQHAESVSKAKTIFLANMSHELRTPLVGILGYSELLAKELKSPDTKEMAEGINRTGRRLLNTLSLVLDLTRVESDKYEMQIKEVEIIEALKESCNNFKGALSVKNIDFNFKPHTDSCILNTDLEMVNTIIENLINNAIKFTTAGEISIYTGLEKHENKEYFFINVIDTGIGIKEEDLSNIFMEFKQLSEGTTKGWPGTGLGLSITKKYIELLNGKIIVNSQFGKGSSFKVMLPI